MYQYYTYAITAMSPCFVRLRSLVPPPTIKSPPPNPSVSVRSMWCSNFFFNYMGVYVVGLCMQTRGTE